MNANPEVPVQMVMPELSAGQPMQNENVTSSAQSNSVMHSTMSMAQSPLQQVIFFPFLIWLLFLILAC